MFPLIKKMKTRSASGIGASLATLYKDLNMDMFCEKYYIISNAMRFLPMKVHLYILIKNYILWVFKYNMFSFE